MDGKTCNLNKRDCNLDDKTRNRNGRNSNLEDMCSNLDERTSDLDGRMSRGVGVCDESVQQTTSYARDVTKTAVNETKEDDNAPQSDGACCELEDNLTDESDMVARALAELGSYESDVSKPNSTHDDFLHNKKKCKKNPGHTRFIPVHTFSMDDLLEPYRDKDVFNYVMALVPVTAKIVVSYTSWDRPKGYLSWRIRGKRFTRLGSGVVDVVYEGVEDDNCPCPCQICAKSGRPLSKWWRVRVATARHVVYCTEEAKHTIVELFFDDDGDRDKVKTLYGLTVVGDSEHGDWCVMDCVTHDKELADDLRERRRHLKECNKIINKKHKRNRSQMAVIISHPHGCSKQISVGEWIDTKWEMDEDTETERSFYTYNTPTCNGSSGAPVRIMGQGGFGSHKHTHRMGFGRHGDVNKSGSGWDSRP